MSKAKPGDVIDQYDLAFVRGRNRNKAHSKLLDIFESSDVTKAELAKMLGKRPEQITRWLGGPGNLTLDTLSDIVFALKGEFLEVNSVDELSKGVSNRRTPEWLAEVNDVKRNSIQMIVMAQTCNETIEITSDGSNSITFRGAVKEKEYEQVART